jgi:hypothetical protein
MNARSVAASRTALVLQAHKRRVRHGGLAMIAPKRSSMLTHAGVTLALLLMAAVLSAGLPSVMRAAAARAVRSHGRNERGSAAERIRAARDRPRRQAGRAPPHVGRGTSLRIPPRVAASAFRSLPAGGQGAVVVGGGACAPPPVVRSMKQLRAAEASFKS